MSGDGFGLGLPRAEVGLRAHDSRWESAYRETEERLQALIGELVVAIEHIGSTAVPGLIAKPILDIALAFPDRASLDQAALRLGAEGYEWRGDSGDKGGVVFVDGLEARRIAHLHLVEIADPQWERYVRFRNLLRRDADVRRRYEALKLELAERFPRDRLAYTDGKDRFVRESLDALEG